jgi:superoxide dismutase, Fe-Mn family
MDASSISRRGLLGNAAFTAVAATSAAWLGRVARARSAEAGDAPSSSPASDSALATGALIALPYEALPGFLSKDQLGLHHAKHYGGALKALKSIEDRAYSAEGVTDAAARRELGKTQSEKANSVILHELYFRGMVAKAPDPADDIKDALTKRFGSLDRWRADLELCALNANGWAMLAAHPINGRLYHVVSDAHDVGPLWLARPLVIIDMYEHAYYVDWKNDKAAYVKAWFDHIDWIEADRRWKAAQ